MPGKTRLPWSKWFADSWLGASDLKLCSMEAKGLWIDMLCIMMQNPQPFYGFLLNPERHVMSVKELARVVGRSPRLLHRILGELLAKDICSKCPVTGALYSRKLVHDAEVSRSKARKKTATKDPDLVHQMVDPPLTLSVSSPEVVTSSASEPCQDDEAERAHAKWQQAGDADVNDQAERLTGEWAQWCSDSPGQRVTVLKAMRGLLTAGIPFKSVVTQIHARDGYGSNEKVWDFSDRVKKWWEVEREYQLTEEDYERIESHVDTYPKGGWKHDQSPH